MGYYCKARFVCGAFQNKKLKARIAQITRTNRHTHPVQRELSAVAETAGLSIIPFLTYTTQQDASVLQMKHIQLCKNITPPCPQQDCHSTLSALLKINFILKEETQMMVIERLQPQQLGASKLILTFKDKRMRFPDQHHRQLPHTKKRHIRPRLTGTQQFEHCRSRFLSDQESEHCIKRILNPATQNRNLNYAYHGA